MTRARRTEDILIVARNSSLSVMEKLLVCCPIFTSSPCEGAKISLVMARMLLQLLINSSVARLEAWTRICADCQHFPYEPQENVPSSGDSLEARWS
jgi:hypothetical protein